MKTLKIFSLVFLLMACGQMTDENLISIKEPFFWNSECHWVLELPSDLEVIPINPDSANNFKFVPALDEGKIPDSKFKLFFQAAKDEKNYLSCFWQKSNFSDTQELFQYLSDNKPTQKTLLGQIPKNTTFSDYRLDTIGGIIGVASEMKITNPSSGEFYMTKDYQTIIDKQIIKIGITGENIEAINEMDSAIVNSHFGVKAIKRDGVYKMKKI